MFVAVTAGFHRARRSWSLFAVVVATTGMASTAVAQTSGLARPWTLSLNLQQAYETNAQYIAGDQGGSFVTRLNAGLGRRFPGKRRQFAIGLDGGVSFYGSSAEGSQLTWGVAAQGTLRPSRKTTVAFGLRSSEGYWRDNPDALGELPPYTRTRSDGATASVRYRLDPSLEGHLEVRGDRYGFPSNDFEDGWSVLGRGALSRALGQSARAGLAAEWERTSTYGQELRHRAVARERPGASRARRAAPADGGLASYRSADLAGPAEVTPTVTLGAVTRVGRHTFSTQVGRRVGQQYGLGSVGVSRFLSIAYDYSVSRRFRVAAGASVDQFISGSYPGAAPPDTQSVGAGVSYRVTRRLAARLDYAFWRSESLGGRSENHTVTAGVSRAFSWR